MWHKIFSAFSLASVFLTPGALSQHFVNQAVVGGANDGSSWENAFSDLQSAITVAVYGDTIWVAEGIYFPTATTDRSISFILKNGIKMYGGFAGDEISLSARDLSAHQTILSGDIGEPGNVFDNSFHVVFGRGVDGNSVLDGFTISDAYGSNAPFSGSQMDPKGGGLLLLGAWDLSESAPLIRNCRFEKNYSSQGGGIYCSWKDEDFPGSPSGLVNPMLVNCQFVGNYAYAGGGGMMKVGPTGLGDTLLIDRCLFYGNVSSQNYGGGIFFQEPNSSSIRMYACVFEKDSSMGGGGGLTFFPDYEGMDKNNLWLDDCIFKENVAPEGAGLFFGGANGLGHTEFSITMKNCTFEANHAQWNNGAAYFIQANEYSKIWATLEHCLFLKNRTWTNLTTVLSVWNQSEVYLDVNNCVFMDNDPNTTFTAALHCGVGGSNTSVNNIGKVNVNNCLFANNGAGLAMLSNERAKMETHVRNCTFFNNNKYILTKSYYTSYLSPNSPYYNKMYIDNCIAWEPRADLKTFLYNNVLNQFGVFQFNVNNSMFTLNPSDTLIPPGAQLAYGDYVYLNVYPEFNDTLAGDFRLKSCSPLRGKGNNSIVSEANLLTDLDGNPRIQFGNVDLGAYEIQDSCLSIASLEPQQQLLQIWPNPSIDGHLQFYIPTLEQEEGILTVCNSSGVEILREKISIQNSSSIDLSYLPTNNYTIQVHSGKKIYAAKWLKL
jgi:hypothetical protein